MKIKKKDSITIKIKIDKKYQKKKKLANDILLFYSRIKLNTISKLNLLLNKLIF